MADNEGIPLATLARGIVNECADAIFQRVFHLKGEEDADAELEGGILIVMLTGLMIRAERKGIAWRSIQIAAELCHEREKAQQLTDKVQ